MRQFTERYYQLYSNVQSDLEIARQAWQKLVESVQIDVAQLVNLHSKIDQLWQTLAELEKAWGIYAGTYNDAKALDIEIGSDEITKLQERLCLEDLDPIEAAYREISK